MSAPGPIRSSATTKDNWGTPQYIFDFWNERYNFQYDAAADETNHKCEEYMDETFDSLARNWPSPARFWLNPPFGNLLGWVERCAIENQERQATILSLFPNNTDTKWFSRAFATASRIIFLEGRISFIDPTTGKAISGNPGGSVFVAWHPTPYRLGKPEVEVISIPKPKEAKS
jgi:phage N-6-adenine-methyltransferase